MRQRWTTSTGSGQLPLCLVGLLVMAVGVWAQGSEYVDKENGFRLVVPTGWSRVKSESLVEFQRRGSSLKLSVERAAFEEMTPKGFLAVHRLIHSNDLQSEERVSLSGLAATKFTYRGVKPNEARRAWQIYVFTEKEEWHLYVSGPESALNSPQSSEYREIQGMLDSFQFLEPTLSRLKKGLWTPAPKK